MSNPNSRKRPTRNEQREAARAKARELREQNAKKARSRKWILQGGIAVAVVAVIAIVVIPITQSVNSSKSFVRPANMASDGIVLQGPNMAALLSPAGADGSAGITSTTPPVAGKANIVLFEDYQCSHCKDFAAAMDPTLQELVNSGAATLDIHPIAMLKTDYSARAANAAACVANFSPDSFWAFNEGMFANQNLSMNESQIKELIALLKPQNQASIDSCISGKTFSSWVKNATEAATSGAMLQAAKAAGESTVGTPSVLVNGQKVPQNAMFDKTAFLAFVAKASLAK